MDEAKQPILEETATPSLPETRFFFDSAAQLDAAVVSDHGRNLTLIEEMFSVRLSAKQATVCIEGALENTARAVKFLEALNQAVKNSAGTGFDQRDFELLCRAFAGCSENDLARLWNCRIHVSPRKKEIMPRSLRQMKYVQSMRENDVIFGIGPAGTGKTYLAMALAVSDFLAGKVNRIVLTRPARESGENLGFLPGNLEEKIMPYLRPLYDALYDMLTREEADELIRRGVIEVAPLAFMRGRTLNQAFIILDEAQNTTEEQMLMFLTRMGFSSKCIITGDPTQSDLMRGERSGLKRAQERLSGISRIDFCCFQPSDVVRHSLLEKIIDAYCDKKEGSSYGAA